MSRVRVPILGTIGKAVLVEKDATIGAKIGTNLQLPDGTTPSLIELAAALAIETVAAGQVRSFQQLIDSIADTQVPASAVTQHAAAIAAAMNLDDIGDVNLTGAADNDLIVRVGGVWVDTAGLLTWDGTNFSATQFGGIIEANLVDKSAVEDIAEQWSFKRDRNGPGKYAITIEAATPFQEFKATGASADEGRWSWGALATSFVFRSNKDNDDTGTAWLIVNRTAEVVDNATFGVPILAVSYDGITAANLVDKSDVEVITGNWFFTGLLTIPAASVVAHESALTIAESQIDDANVLVRIAENETITGNKIFKSAFGIKIQDVGGTDDVQFSHDGTDLNVAGTLTANINITGITSIQAGTVDADFDAITATSYGAIAEANLTDKTASEVISGAREWQGNVGFYSTTPIAQPANITDAVTAHALNPTFSDTEVEAALNALGVKFNDLKNNVIEALGLSA